MSMIENVLEILKTKPASLRNGYNERLVLPELVQQRNINYNFEYHLMQDKQTNKNNTNNQRQQQQQQQTKQQSKTEKPVLYPEHITWLLSNIDYFRTPSGGKHWTKSNH